MKPHPVLQQRGKTIAEELRIDWFVLVLVNCLVWDKEHKPSLCVYISL